MIRFLINRPIAVSMAFLAFVILGIITYFNVPISLLPNIPIPEMTVQISGSSISARELENTVVSPIRQQLLQISNLRDIKSETKDGHATIKLTFEYGVNTDLAFIEVNEKIDASMNGLPKNQERPRVIKSNASDIPIFTINLTFKHPREDHYLEETRFMELSELVQNSIRRRFEQLPQVAMVDITGLLDKQIKIIPYHNILEISGIDYTDISTALVFNNIEPGSMSLKDGQYEYSLNFSSIVRTLEDIQQIQLKKNGRIYFLKDLAKIEINHKPEEGFSLYNGKRAIMMGIIKQSEENVSDLQTVLAANLAILKREYPDIDFSISQNQSELLEYTISNLKQNLILAFIFVCLVSALFMNDVKSPLIISLIVAISLIISLLFFYLFKVSLNIISLTGLVLALGMMIDNAIIVTDNINQYRINGDNIEEACVKGANEVIAPILSSSFTTISVFIPLIFMSGIAGALFFDQAFSVAVGLFVSYLTGIILLPVLYRIIYSINFRWAFRKKTPEDVQNSSPKGLIFKIEKLYHMTADWVFSHKTLTTIITCLIFPLCVIFFLIIKKEKMPQISQNELIIQIDWNENIHEEENRERSVALMAEVSDLLIEHSSLIGRQQFILNKNEQKSNAESELYVKTRKIEDIPEVKNKFRHYIEKKYPRALLKFAPMGTIFEKIFSTSEPELRIEYYTKKQQNDITEEKVDHWRSSIKNATKIDPTTISFEKQLDLLIDKEKLVLYNVTYDEVFRVLNSAFKNEEISVLRSYQQYIPIVIGQTPVEIHQALNKLFVSSTSKDNSEKRIKIPIKEFVTISQNTDRKTIIAGSNGEYVPFEFSNIKDPEATLATLKNWISKNASDVALSGLYFSNRKMLGEMINILVVSLLLMYFILAAQFESFLQPVIVLLEIPIAITSSLGLLILFGYSLNLMSAIGIIITCGIIINDSILKLDIINQLRKKGVPIMEAIHESGRRRLTAIFMTSLTSIVCMLPLLFSHDIGSELEKPLALATISGMVIGTPISLFIVPLFYWFLYRGKKV